MPIIAKKHDFHFDLLTDVLFLDILYMYQKVQLERGDCLHIVISNSSDLPIYAQIKEQVKEQILSGELEEDEMLPSLRQLARDLKISVLTTTRAYNELEEEGFITSRQGKGFFVMSSGSNLIREQLIQEVEKNLSNAILAAERASMPDEELIKLLQLLLEVNHE